MEIGPITSLQNNPDNFFATDLLKGHSVIFELFEPQSGLGKSRLHISKVIHGYKQTFGEYAGYGQSASCNIDVNCSQGTGWVQESNAVAMILLSNGERFCSGAMINNVCKDFKAYLLTAFHCLDGNQGSWVFRFKYKSPSCNGGDGTSYYSYNGSTLKASWSATDFALLELATRPQSSAGITYAGWSRSSTGPTSSVGIHHPNGDVMKISVENNQAISNASSLNWSDGTISPSNSHWTISYDIGGIQPGSSGSPLFNPNHQIVGQLHGGRGTCPGDAGFQQYYGRFDVSWNGGGTPSTRLKDWLDPNNTGVTAINANIIPSISGNFTANSCANATATFSVSNPTAGLSYSWSVTSGLQIVGSATGSSVTVKVVGNGNQYVNLSVVTSCGTQKLAEKMVNVGIPAITVTTYDDRTPQYSNYTYHSAYAELLPGTTSGNYKWYESVNGQFTNLIATGTSLHQWPIPPCTSKTYRLEVTTPCGIAYWNGYAYNTNCNSTYTAYPNPASDELIIESVREGEANEQTGGISASNANEEEIGIKLYNQFGEVVLSEKSKKAKTTLNTKALKDGLYYLHITDKKGETSKQQIQINH